MRAADSWVGLKKNMRQSHRKHLSESHLSLYEHYLPESCKLCSFHSGVNQSMEVCNQVTKVDYKIVCKGALYAALRTLSTGVRGLQMRNTCYGSEEWANITRGSRFVLTWQRKHIQTVMR